MSKSAALFPSSSWYHIPRVSIQFTSQDKSGRLGVQPSSFLPPGVFGVYPGMRRTMQRTMHSHLPSDCVCVCMSQIWAGCLSRMFLPHEPSYQSEERRGCACCFIDYTHASETHAHAHAQRRLRFQQPLKPSSTAQPAHTPRLRVQLASKSRPLGGATHDLIGLSYPWPPLQSLSAAGPGKMTGPDRMSVETGQVARQPEGRVGCGHSSRPARLTAALAHARRTHTLSFSELCDGQMDWLDARMMLRLSTRPDIKDRLVLSRHTLFPSVASIWNPAASGTCHLA